MLLAAIIEQHFHRQRSIDVDKTSRVVKTTTTQRDILNFIKQLTNAAEVLFTFTVNKGFRVDSKLHVRQSAGKPIGDVSPCRRTEF